MKHILKKESNGLAYGMNGYRCTCGEGIACNSMAEARKLHKKTHTSTPPVNEKLSLCPSCHYMTKTIDNTCGKCHQIKSPVNESWEVEFQKEMMLLCWEIEKLPASEQQTKVVILAGKIKDNLKKFFGEQSTLLSNARQEAKAERTEEIRKAIHEEPVVLVDTRFNPDDKSKYEHAILYERIKHILDSLTSKGGTNGN